jgi:hypothetical protein
MRFGTKDVSARVGGEVQRLIGVGWNHNAANLLDPTHPIAVNPYVRPRLKSTMPICPMKMPKRRGLAFAHEDWAGCPPLRWASEPSGERGAAVEDAAAVAPTELS